MEQAGAFRHELKYALSPGDELALRRRMRAVIPHDAHAGPDGRYRIRSIYFDNIYDKALREKIDGVQKREKFRIRYYNDDLSYIVLEKKIKYNALCQKLEAPLTQEECRSILDGPAEWMLGAGTGALLQAALPAAAAARAGIVCPGAVRLRRRKRPRDV